MKKMLLELYKEKAVDARINGSYDTFLESSLHKFMDKRYDLKLIGE